MRLLAAIVVSLLVPLPADAEIVSSAEIEIRPRNASSVGLLSIFSLMRGHAIIVANPANDRLLSFEARTLELDAIRAEVLAGLGLRETTVDGVDVAFPGRCAHAFQPSGISDQRRVTIRFPDIEIGAVLRLAADVAGLEVDFPHGLPQYRIAIDFRNRPVEQLFDALGHLTGARFRIDGKRIEIRRGTLPRGCSLAREEWRQPKDGSLELLPVAQDVWSLDPLRGYIAFTPRSPLNAIVIDEYGTYYPGAPGDLFDSQHVFGSIDREVIELVQKKSAVVEDGIPRYYLQFDVGSGKRLAGRSKGDVGEYRRVWLERYALEDLWVESIQQTEGVWRATIRDAHGLRHTAIPRDYVGPHSGKVIAISASGLEISQVVPVRYGMYREVPVRLALNERFEYPCDKLRRMMKVPIAETSLQRDFISAAAAGDVANLAKLLKQGASIDASDGDHLNNALGVAAFRRHAEAVKWLLEHGARCNLFIDSGKEGTPLIAAVIGGSMEVVASLLAAGADPHIPDILDETPLHHATDVGGSLSILELLLEAGADPVKQNDIGFTPPILAAMRGRLDMVGAFLDRGFSVNAQARWSLTLVETAVDMNNAELTRFLIERGAEVEPLWGEHAARRGALEDVDPELLKILETTRAKQRAQSEQPASKTR